jgi:predicted CoA-binding protein
MHPNIKRHGIKEKVQEADANPYIMGMKPVIAVIGAGSDRRKFGNKCVRTYLAAGYDVVPIHPMDETVEGLPAYRSIADAPQARFDRVSVYLPPAVGLKVMDQVATKDVGELWLNPGADGEAVIARARELGLNVVCGCSIVDAGYSPGQFPDE